MLPTYRNGGSALDTLVSMSREMDRLVNTALPEQARSVTWLMPAEVVETGDEVRFDIEVPGMAADEIHITLEHNVLTVTGEKKQRNDVDEDSYRLVERRYGRFQRSFTVPPTVRPDSCDASYENGVLTIRLAKAEEARPRRIRVNAAGGARQIEEQSSK